MRLSYMFSVSNAFWTLMVHISDMTQMHRSASKHRRLSCLQAPDLAPAFKEKGSARGYHLLF